MQLSVDGEVDVPHRVEPGLNADDEREEADEEPSPDGLESAAPSRGDVEHEPPDEQALEDAERIGNLVVARELDDVRAAADEVRPHHPRRGKEQSNRAEQTSYAPNAP